MENMRELTRAEMEIMLPIWRIQSGFLSDIVKQIPEPRPAYTTVSTIIRILVKKGFVGFKVYGKSNSYYPLVDKRAYSEMILKSLQSTLFDDSAVEMLSFVVKRAQITEEQRRELIEKL